jgi:hypothetical protein
MQSLGDIAQTFPVKTVAMAFKHFDKGFCFAMDNGGV